MNLLKSFVLATLMMLAAPVLAQTTTLPADSAAMVADVPEIAPAPAGMGEREKCKQGMGGNMADGGKACCKGKQGGAGKMGCEKCASMSGRMSHGGMPCCGGMHGGGAGDTAMLERRINELEKRLDLMQQLLQARKR